MYRTMGSSLVTLLGMAVALLSIGSWNHGVMAETSSATTTGIVPMPERWLPESIELDENLMEWKDVVSCCRVAVEDESCPSSDADGSEQVVALESITIGRMPQFTTEQTLSVLNVAESAWDGGAGPWTQMSLEERCTAMEKFFDELAKNREEMVQALMMEIGKNRLDAEAEFDRTVQFAKQVINIIRTDPEYIGAQWQTIGGTRALVRRSAIGIILALAPYNYPLNECYAVIIPALLMGNVIILKIPTTGGLVHLLTMEAFSKTLPKGTVNFISGSGRKTMPPLMETGKIDGLGFIGGSNAADDLIKKHPNPHRLKVFLQLEANNMAIYLPDLFKKGNDAVLTNALEQAVIGSLSYNGQRCTALKLHFVPSKFADRFVSSLVKEVESLPVGLPDQQHGAEKQYSKITPLPTTGRIKYMKELLDDAISKGAKIMNKDGGKVIGGADSTLMVPAVLFPVTSDMRLYHEEQFGPLVPVTTYDSLDTILEFGKENPYGQQISIFGQNVDEVSSILDKFSSVFARVNLNSQCGRSPDTLPFAGRRSSAMGVMSVSHALKEFSVPTVVAYSAKNDLVGNEKLVEGLHSKSKFLHQVA